MKTQTRIAQGKRLILIGDTQFFTRTQWWNTHFLSFHQLNVRSKGLRLLSEACSNNVVNIVDMSLLTTLATSFLYRLNFVQALDKLEFLALVYSLSRFLICLFIFTFTQGRLLLDLLIFDGTCALMVLLRWSLIFSQLEFTVQLFVVICRKLLEKSVVSSLKTSRFAFWKLQIFLEGLGWNLGFILMLNKIKSWSEIPGRT